MKLGKPLTTLAAAFALALVALPALGAGVVNVNKADEGQLALLPRVGPALAARILEFREANGKFGEAEDLMLVRGIGEKTMELLAPFVVTSGDTTLTSKVSLSEAQEAASKPRQNEPQKKDEKEDSEDGDSEDGEDG